MIFFLSAIMIGEVIKFCFSGQKISSFFYLQQMIIYETNQQKQIDNHNMIKKIKLIKFGDFPSNQSINQQIKDQSNHSIIDQ